MAIKLEVGCGNWTTIVEVEGKVFEKKSDMCIEAMTMAIENFLNGRHDKFVISPDDEAARDMDSTEIRDLTLDHFVTCDGNICMTQFILINAGRHDIARLIKTP